MKRKQYRIKSTAGHDVIKNAWNSSIREIERLAGELAKETGASYTLTASESVKDGFDYVSGHRVWTNSKNGCAVVFSIKRIA